MPKPRRNYEDIKSFNWQVMRLVWPYLMEFKYRIAIGFLCLIATKVTSVYVPFILKDIVDKLEVVRTEPLILVPFGLVAAYGLVRFANVIFAEIRDLLFGRVTERAVRRIALKVFEHLHRLDLSFHLERRTGGLSRDIERGTSGIAFVMRFLVFNILPTLLEILMVIGLLLYNYGIWFALITLLSIVAYVWFSVVVTEKRTAYIRKSNKADSSVYTRAIDSLINYETVKYFTNESYESKAYDSYLADHERAKRNERFTLFGLNGGQSLIIAIAMTSMLALAAYQVSHSQMTLGDFVLINAFMMQLFMPLRFLGFVYREIKGSLANIEQMFDLLNVKPKIHDQAGASELVVAKGKITFEHVGFGYKPERKILHDVSFEINPGEKLAIVGHSGAGKSTISKLLFRFYDATDGKVLIDDQDITGVTLDSLRRAIGIVPQDTVLFNDTLFENIRYGNPLASKAQVEEAVSMAYLDEFVSKLPDGLETQVGERGLKLSGGEKQRVAIARTLLKKPRILVFDESTSSLDSKAEQAILTAMERVSRGHTSVVIAHRLSTIESADRILVVDDGRIIEQGTHQQLLNLKGSYYQMWSIQQKQQASHVLSDESRL